MAAKLKVWTWSDGFHAYTMATTSRAKALAAWGVTRDLFKDGDAREITDGPDLAAALADPGETIKRGLTVDVGKAEPLAKAKSPKKADVERVAKLERELALLREAHGTQVAEIAAERERLDARAAKLDEEFTVDEDRVESRLKAARETLKR